MNDSYEVVLHPRARKELDKVSQNDFCKIDAAIWALREQPRPFGVKKLDGDLHRIRIGDWRVIYSIHDHDRRVVVHRVARRSGKTYRGLA